MPYFQEHQDTLFIVVTAPPVSNGRYSSNARSFNQWLVNDWLKDYPYTNVAVFDFYNVLTTNGGNTDTSDLDQETGNHHRWWNNAVQHQVETGGWLPHDTAAYATAFGDDHPSGQATGRQSGSSCRSSTLPTTAGRQDKETEHIFPIAQECAVPRETTYTAAGLLKSTINA